MKSLLDSEEKRFQNRKKKMKIETCCVTNMYMYQYMHLKVIHVHHNYKLKSSIYCSCYCKFVTLDQPLLVHIITLVYVVTFKCVLIRPDKKIIFFPTSMTSCTCTVSTCDLCYICFTCCTYNILCMYFYIHVHVYTPSHSLV